jgi:hypothetical protein
MAYEMKLNLSFQKFKRRLNICSEGYILTQKELQIDVLDNS